MAIKINTKKNVELTNNLHDMYNKASVFDEIRDNVMKESVKKYFLTEYSKTHISENWVDNIYNDDDEINNMDEICKIVQHIDRIEKFHIIGYSEYCMKIRNIEREISFNCTQDLEYSLECFKLMVCVLLDNL